MSSLMMPTPQRQQQHQRSAECGEVCSICRVYKKPSTNSFNPLLFSSSSPLTSALPNSLCSDPMARHNPALERPRVARRPAGQARHRGLIKVVMGALSIAVAGSLISLPLLEHGEMDSASMVYLTLCLITFILGFLLLCYFIAGVRLPPVLANCLVLATVAAMVAVLLFSPPASGRQLMATPKAKQQGKCIIPVSGGSLPSSGNDGECPLFCEVGRRGKGVVCF